MNTTVEFEVRGKYALFTDPVTKIGGEKLSYPVPTYEALKGIMKSIYWKPTITWIIDAVRILNPIQLESKGTKTLAMDGEHSLAYNTCLQDVGYQVKAHFEFNQNRPEFKDDWNEKKHLAIAKRAVERGGRRDVFLGTRENQAEIDPCVFGSGEGYYDHSGELAFGVMFHGFNYPDETGGKMLETRLWLPKMVNGVLDFIRPEDCRLVRQIREMDKKTFIVGENLACAV